MLSLSNMLNEPKRPAILDITNLLNQEPMKSPSLSPSSSPTSSTCSLQQDDWDSIKKRKRASTEQLQVLQKVFDRTFFPSTQVRADLGRQLNMSPRTVQIWFQNRRQAMRTKERQRLIKLEAKSI